MNETGNWCEENHVDYLFTNTALLVAEDLPKGQKYNQSYFISDILRESEREKPRYKRRNQGRLFVCAWALQKVMVVGNPGKIRYGRLCTRSVSTLFASPESMPLLIFGIAKRKMKDGGFHMVQVIRGRLTEIWKGLTFEDARSACLEWKIWFNWVIRNGGGRCSESKQKNGDLLGTHSQESLWARLSGQPISAFFTKLKSAEVVTKSCLFR
jgi:hypothetical protein